MSADSTPAVYELPPKDRRPPPNGRALHVQREREATLLRENARWFCQLRWIVVAVLLVAGLGAFVFNQWRFLGVEVVGVWPLAAAAVLLVANLGYLEWLKRRTADDLDANRLLVWVQIVVDLLVLTYVAHHLGSLTSYAPFMYLAHIILSCIFFPPLQSLLVTFTAAGFFVVCLVLEATGIVPPASIFPATALPPESRQSVAAGMVVWQVMSAFVIWAAIWYLASRLSSTLRRREAELAASNVRLEASSRERMRHMLQTTHQLKAPFAAIHANVQLLLQGYCGVLPEQAVRVAEKIAQRSVLMSEQIQSMLQLANLRSESQLLPEPEDVDLAEVVESLVRRVEPTARQRQISIETELRPAPISTRSDHLSMILDNLLTNAVNYSQDGQTVQVTLQEADGNHVSLMIRDRGIGIPAEKLPHIFDDYYRTDEAARHYHFSTGLGLAVVRDAARACGIGVRVETASGWGTRVWLNIPKRLTHPGQAAR